MSAHEKEEHDHGDNHSHDLHVHRVDNAGRLRRIRPRQMEVHHPPEHIRLHELQLSRAQLHTPVHQQQGHIQLVVQASQIYIVQFGQESNTNHRHSEFIRKKKNIFLLKIFIYII